MAKVAPSMLSADFTKLAEEIKSLEAGGADMLHIDVMDGHFVPNLTFGAPVIKALRKVTKLPFDVHLMVTNPEDHIKPFVDAGADYITFHAEATPHMHRLVQEIKGAGVKAGIAINPATPVAALEDIAASLDLLLIMSVNPGFGGQSFIPHSVRKVKKAAALMQYLRNVKAEIAVDGGINAETAQGVREAGATLLVAGSAIFGAKNRADMIVRLRGEEKK